MTTNETERDYEVAERELRSLIDSKGLALTVTPDFGNTCNEKDQQRFAFSIHDSKANSVSGTWSCGSAVALFSYTKHRPKLPFGALPCSVDEAVKAAKQQFGGVCIDYAAARKAIRQHFKPSLFDIVSSLLSDANSIEGFDDWTDWAEEMGAFSPPSLDLSDSKRRTTAADVRKLQADFALIRQQRATLRAMLGADYEKAADCASRL